MNKMKLIMATLGLTLLAACSSKENIYEKAIADYVQTDRYGTWTDLNFKVISMEAKECTVTDSIKILVEDARIEKEEAISFETKRLNEYEAGLEKNSKARYPSPSIEKMYREYITQSRQRLDSLRLKDPNTITCYKGLEPDEVLAVYVTCKYGINYPDNGAYQERTDTFILTQEGEKVIGKERRKNKHSHN